MESRLNDILTVHNNILSECEKMSYYVQQIKDKSEDVISYIQQFDTSTFLKKYISLYKYLHSLNEMLVDHNCQFELFFMKLEEPTELTSALTSAVGSISNIKSNTSICDINKINLEDAKQRDSIVGKESIPCLLNTDNNYIKQISQTEKPEEINKTDSHLYLPSTSGLNYKSESSETNSISDVSSSCDKKSTTSQSENENLLNINSVIKNIDDRTKEKQPNRVKIPDLRATVVTKRSYDNTSSSEQQSIVRSTEKHFNKHKKVTENNVHNTKLVRKDTDKLYKEINVTPAVIPKEGDLCYISYVETPSSFCIQIISEDTSLIDYLSDQIVEVLQSLKCFNTKSEARKNISNYCVCYLEDSKTWYRASIKNWMEDDPNKIEVQLIDYGNNYLLELKYIREAIPYFFALPIMANKCKLAWAQPPNNEKTWSSDTIEYFKNILCAVDDRLFYLSYVQNNGDELIIDLQNNEMHSLAGELIALGKAEDDHKSLEDSDDWCNDFMKAQVIKSQGFDEEELLKNDNEKEIDVDYEECNDPTIAVAHYKPRDENEICRIFQTRGYCFKENNCKFSHTPLNPDGWTTDRDAVYYDSLSQLMLPLEGEEITVKIVSIVNLKSFYVHVKNLPQPMGSITQPIKTIKQLVTLMNDPEEVKKYKKLKVKPALGELILIKHNCNSWQRGKVLECYENCNQVKLDVLLVDFGIVVQQVDMKDCYIIQEKHLYLPFQVIKCNLANVMLKDNITEEESDMGCDYLEMNVLHKKLKAKILHRSLHLEILLYNEQGADIGEELIKSGIVLKNPGCLANPNSQLLID